MVLLGVVAGAAPAAGQAGSPAGTVPVERLAARRAKLLAKLDGGIAVLRSGEVKSIEGDYPQDSDYREKNDFFYLTGIEEPDSWLVLDASGPADRQARLYLPPRNPQEEQWTGVRLGPGPEAVSLSGITDVRSADKAESGIGALVREATAANRPIFTDLKRAGSADCRGYTPHGRSCAPALDAVDADPSVAPQSLDRITAELRLVKDADEIRRLRRAIDITTAADSALAAVIEPGMYEYQLEAAIEYTFRERGAERVGFPSIVGSGPNSTTLHYDKNRRKMDAGDLVVVDIGAEFGYYSADVTRTFPVSGRYTDRQRAIYDLVLGAQQAAMDAVRPGQTLAGLSRIARAYIDAHSGSLCGSASCNRYFVHGLSHWLGMDVHDVGALSAPLEPGMVFTIEPGIYIEDEQLGIRIEDDVLVTENGFELLSAGAPRTADDVERMIAAARTRRTARN